MNLTITMATAIRGVTLHPRSSQLTSLVTEITSCLQALNPTNLNTSHINTSSLNQFSPYLHQQLVIEVIKTQTNPFHALLFFNWASNPNPNPNSYTHTDRCYLAITDILLSRSLISIAQALLQKCNKLSDSTVSKLITAYGNIGHIKGAIFWFHKVKTIETGICLFSYNALLGALVKANQISLAQTFFYEIVNSDVVEPDASTYSIMIKGFCKVGLVENARKVFDEMKCKPNLYCYNSLINGYCKKGDMLKAVAMFNRLIRSEDGFPNAVTYTTLIDGYCKKGEFDEAMKKMVDMELRCCKPNLLTYNTLINCLCLRGKVDEAKKLLTEMRSKGVKENTATHLSILKGLCSAGKSDEAVKHFRWMIAEGMKDTKAYETVIYFYCKIRETKMAIELLKEMHGEGIKPNVSCFNVVLRGLMEVKESNIAIFLLKQMQKMGSKPNICSYSTVICGLCQVRGRMQDANKLINNMIIDGLAIDATMYSSLVMGYCEDGNEGAATQIFQRAIDDNYVISLESFSVFVKLLRDNGKAIAAKRILKEMCEKCSVIDVESYSKVLDEQSATHLEGKRMDF